MHFWSKFGNPHLIWYWLIARTNSQAQNGVNFDFQVQFDLEDHRQSPHKTIGILIKVFYISDPNLVILAWTVDELSHGQAHDWRTHTHTQTHTHAGNDNTRRPKLALGKKSTKKYLSFWFLKAKYSDELYAQNIRALESSLSRDPTIMLVLQMPGSFIFQLKPRAPSLHTVDHISAFWWRYTLSAGLTIS